MNDQQIPAGPWRWQGVTPEGEARQYGEALVDADGVTWVLWSEGGYGAPEVHPAVKQLLARAWELGVPTSELPWRDHDHSVEDAVLRAFEAPTPENQHAAELAVALLQRCYDHVLRRLDGTGDLPPYPSHPHKAAEHPVDCLTAVLHELAGMAPDLVRGAGAVLADRAETPRAWPGSAAHAGAAGEGGTPVGTWVRARNVRRRGHRPATGVAYRPVGGRR